MNWRQEMGWKNEPTRVIQAQLSWKVRLLSGSYCSHEIRIGEGSQMLPRSCFIVRKTLLTKDQDFHLQLQMDVREFKMQPMVWNWLQTFLVFIKHCPQLQLGLAVMALITVPWTNTDRSREEEALPPSLPGFPGFQANLISLALEYLLPFTVGWSLWQIFGELSFPEVLCHLASAVLFKPGCSLLLRPQQSFSWGVSVPACSVLPCFVCSFLRTPRGGAHSSRFPFFRIQNCILQFGELQKEETFEVSVFQSMTL